MTAARCECCGELRRFFYGSTDADGRRIRIQVEGWDDEVEGWQAAAKLARDRIREVEALRLRPHPPSEF